MAVTQRLRFEIMKRDNHRCYYCGATAEDAKLTVDHVVPIALGGTDDPTNLVTACRPCNSGKSSVPPTADLVAQVADDAVRFASALESVTAQRRAAVAEMAANVSWFNERWNRWTYRGRNDEPMTIERDDDWATSVERFFAAGLDRSDLDRLIDIAMGFKARDTWRFFCGKAWQEIRERQDAARAALSTPQAAAEADPDDWGTPDYKQGYSDGFSDSESYWVDKGRRLAGADVEEAYERGFREGVARATGARDEPAEIIDAIDDWTD